MWEVAAADATDAVVLVGTNSPASSSSASAATGGREGAADVSVVEGAAADAVALL